MQILNETKNVLNKYNPKVLPVLMFPHETLFNKSNFILKDFSDDKEINRFIKDLVHTCKHHQAAGISAIQVGVALRIMVVRDDLKKYIVMVNPVIENTEGNAFEDEGCLSFPYLFTKINRAAKVEVSYSDEFGVSQKMTATGLLCKAILHEIDHLEGKTFLDRMNFVQRTSALKKLKQYKRKLKNL